MDFEPDDETLDTILGGGLAIVQPLRGYRFAVDALLLGRFARPRARDRVLELGTGCGVVSLMLAALYQPRAIVALELQSELAALATRNAALNHMDHLTVLHADLRARRIAGAGLASFDYVVANPPYRALGSGRDSPNRGRRLARAESGANLADFVAAAGRFVRNSGRVALVFTAARVAELVAQLKLHRLEPKRMRFVHPRADSPAAIVLIEARKGGGVEAEVEPPLILYSRRGVYSDEARALLALDRSIRHD
jgi:tRNA1Val (adenine37-N6)-methyltransferase